MNTKRTMLIAGLMVTIGGVVGAWMMLRQPPEKVGESVQERPQPVPAKAPESTAPAPKQLPVREVAPIGPSAPPARLRKPEAPTARTARGNALTNAAPQAIVQDSQALTYNGYTVQDPLARVALYFTGEEPDATEYWLEAVNDSSLPSEERKDLIEDLNETGLSDPEYPSTPEDWRKILNRIAILEDFEPMDQVNADAAQEALKDLVGLVNGQPPQ